MKLTTRVDIPRMGFSIQDENGVEVGFIPAHPGQQPYDARLIALLFAAAPELLEMLEDVLLTGGDSYRHWGNKAQREAHKEMLDRTRAAIAKAKGETP